MNFNRLAVAIAFALYASFSVAQTPAPPQYLAEKEIPLPTSKKLQEPVPGSPHPTNSLPVTMALSPDGKYLALLNSGYGSVESNYEQSIAILETATNQLRDFPDSRLPVLAKQSFFVGLAWSTDGSEIYASIG